MVLLTVTPKILEGIAKCQELSPGSAADGAATEVEPSLASPSVGDPISHGQIIDLWKRLKAEGYREFTLEGLLHGARVYIAPPLPKPEPTAEYKALMARLRRDEEELSYQRMVHPPAVRESFSQRFPSAVSATRAFEEANRPASQDLGDDDVTYADVHRQLMLIFNFLVSIIGVGATLWILARWWSTPARLFLALGGSLLVAIAEVAVYGGYVWHLGEAKRKQEKTSSVQDVVQTWVVGGDTDKAQPATLMEKEDQEHEGVRRRKKGTT